MKRLFLGIFFAVILVLAPLRSVSAANPFQGAFFSAFRNVQVFVEGARGRIARFLGLQNVSQDLSSLRIVFIGDSLEFFIGTEREISWTYENLRESVTRMYLLPEGKPRVLLMFLPAKRNTSGSDAYSFPVRFEPGAYRIQVCNGEACDITELFSILYPVPEEQISDSPLENTSSSPSFSSSTPSVSSTPVIP